jgi:hypothetical protein
MTFHLMFRNLSGLHCCLFVKVLLPLSSNLFILAQVVCFVNNFFELFSSSFWLLAELSFPQSPLAFYQTLSCLSIPFLKNFYFVFRLLYRSASGLYLTHNLSSFNTALTSDFGILSNISSFVNTFLRNFHFFWLCRALLVERLFIIQKAVDFVNSFFKKFSLFSELYDF